MRDIKYRQPLFMSNGNFNSFHYWGWMSDNVFIGPLSMGQNVKNEKGQQFTGLLDKSGKEIYEGDILEFDANEWGGGGNIFAVEWYGKEACFEGNGTPSEWGDWCEVIGNIYENPELLEDLK